MIRAGFFLHTCMHAAVQDAYKAHLVGSSSLVGGSHGELSCVVVLKWRGEGRRGGDGEKEKVCGFVACVVRGWRGLVVCAGGSPALRMGAKKKKKPR